MRERPILFSAPMVRALLAGTKTQTRRVVKWRGVDPGLNFNFSGLRAERIVETWVLEAPTRSSSEWRCQPTYCPYGQPGDLLWCKETWQADPPIDGTWASTAWHGCPEHAPLSEIPERYRLPTHCIYRADWTGGELARWRPSIHMPRWASRILLEVAAVRVERLQDISEEDCIAEGIEPFTDFLRAGHWRRYQDGGMSCYTDSPVTSYASLWESINGPGSWEANPWVWVVEFKRVEG